MLLKGQQRAWVSLVLFAVVACCTSSTTSSTTGGTNKKWILKETHSVKWTEYEDERLTKHIKATNSDIKDLDDLRADYPVGLHKKVYDAFRKQVEVEKRKVHVHYVAADTRRHSYALAYYFECVQICIHYYRRRSLRMVATQKRHMKRRRYFAISLFLIV
jgi:hypothetical protein